MLLPSEEDRRGRGRSRARASQRLPEPPEAFLLSVDPSPPPVGTWPPWLEPPAPTDAARARRSGGYARRPTPIRRPDGVAPTDPDPPTPGA